MGEAYLKNKDRLEHLISWLGRRGYGFLDPSNQTADRNALMRDLTSSYGTFAYINPFWIDDMSSQRDMTRQLSLVEHEARKAGVSLGIMHAYPKSLELLKNWSQTLNEKGIYLVPFASIFIEPDIELKEDSASSLQDNVRPDESIH